MTRFVRDIGFGVRLLLESPGFGLVTTASLAVGLGMGLGLVAAFFVTRLLRGILSGISAADPLAMGAVTLLLAGTAYLACFIPARNASSVDPSVALRAE